MIHWLFWPSLWLLIVALGLAFFQGAFRNEEPKIKAGDCDYVSVD